MDRIRALVARLDAWSMAHRWPRIGRRALSGFLAHEALQYAGSMAYFSVLSLFQLLVLGVVIFSLFLGQGEARRFIVDQVSAGSPLDADDGGRDHRLGHRRSRRDRLHRRAVPGAGARSASSPPCRAGSAAPSPTSKPRGFLADKLIGLALMGITGVLAVASLVVGIVTGILQEAANGVMGAVPGGSAAIGLIGLVVPFLLIFVAFLLIYRIVPNRRVTLGEVWPGALVATLLWTVLRFGFTYYATNVARYDSAFGPISTAVTLLVFLYFASVIILLGAEVARAAALEDDPVVTMAADPRFLPVVVPPPPPVSVPPRRRLPSWLLLAGGAIAGAVAGRLSSRRDD